jgi:hypothetical protein
MEIVFINRSSLCVEEEEEVCVFKLAIIMQRGERYECTSGSSSGVASRCSTRFRCLETTYGLHIVMCCREKYKFIKIMSQHISKWVELTGSDD